MTTICFFSATGGEISLLGPVTTRLMTSHPGTRLWARMAAQLSTPAGQAAFAKGAMTADIVVITMHGGTASFPAWQEFSALFDAAKSAGDHVPYLHIQPAGGDDDAVLTAEQYGDGLDNGLWQAVVALLDTGGADNLTAALSALLDAQYGEVAVPEPTSVPYQGIYHPRLGVFTDLASYLEQFPAQQSRIVMLYPRSYWVDDNQRHVEAMIDAISARGAVPVAVFGNRLADRSKPSLGSGALIDAFCTIDGQVAIDVIVQMTGMSVNLVDPSFHGVFPALGVPVLQAMSSYASFDTWSASAKGMATLDVAIQAAQPEFDGALITKIVATREADAIDPVTGGLIARMIPIPDRIDAMAELACNWAKLRRLSNRDKKVAIMFHHHPPRNDRIGAAAGLDSFESIRRLLMRMAQDGYYLDEQYDCGDDLADQLLGHLTCDRRWLTPEQVNARALAHASGDQARSWHSELPDVVQVAMEKNWGEIPGELFVHDGALSFAGHLNGNVFLTIQPPRGAIEKAIDGSAHDLYLPPPHHYLAHYRWIRDVFGADVIIHVGTHGSLEWLPGKALGLSEECYPELALANLPNIYPYIISNPGEGTQAKRRSACALVDHLTPPMRGSGLYDDCAKVQRTANEYVDAVSQTPSAASLVAEELWDALEHAGLHIDLELTREQALADPGAMVEQVNHYLMELADNQIGDGLHVLGTVAANGGRSEEITEEEYRSRLVTYLGQLTKLPNGDIPSLREAIIAAWGHDVETLTDDAGRDIDGRSAGQILLAAHSLGLEMLFDTYDAYRRGDISQVTIGDIARSKLTGTTGQVEITLGYVAGDFLPRLEQVDQEITSVLAALSGGYVPPGPSGAATRGDADILPSGRNFYSVDPRTLPTPAAWRVGVGLAESLLARYAEGDQAPDNAVFESSDGTGRRWPRNVGIVVWGTANMRSRGEDIAEILYLMGLKPQWGNNGVVRGLTVIPLRELGRPRIDVTPRISGFFRDAFPALIELLDQATQLVAALDESPSDNLIRAHVLADKAGYVQAGMGEAEADRAATLRIFGCPPGTYGAGVSELIESKNWDTRDDLGNAYIRVSSHAYGADIYGQQHPRVFRRLLERMDATVKNEDSREWDMLSCCDFYNYYGGLIAAATTVRGVAPSSYVGDTSDPRRPKTKTTAEQARLIIRSRVLNPTWIEGLQRHGYKGAGDLSKVMDILIGWDATADVVDDQLFDMIANRYALDPAMQAWFNEVNPYALHNILDKLLELANRGLWETSPDMVDDLAAAYVDIEGNIEGSVDAENDLPPVIQ